LVRDIEKLLVILDKLRVIRGRTRFQKIIFLLKHKNKIDLDYNFIPYYYGPYSRDLQLAINLLEAAGFVQVVPESGNLYAHCLTTEGRSVAKQIEQKMQRSEKNYLSEALRSYDDERSTPSLINEAKKLAALPA